MANGRTVGQRGKGKPYIPTASGKNNAADIVRLAPFLEPEQIAQWIMGSPQHLEVIEQFVASEDAGEKAYPTDPVKFMTETLGYQTWGKLEEICYGVRDRHNTVVASSFGVGKSIVASALACWWMCLHDDAKVIVVAPTFSQIQNILFRYIRNVGRKANLPGDLLDSPRWEISAEHFAIGLSPRRSSSEDIASIQGYHGAHLMVIMDEAAGLPRIIWDAAAGLVVGDSCRIVCIGNPIEQAGPFWEACNNPNWKHIAISAFDHPNVVEGREIIPGAVTRQWVEERAVEWATEVEPHTPGSVAISWTNRWYLPQPIFYAKVMGIAPEQAEDQLIRLSWVLDAQDRILEQKHTEIIAGLDPARKGGDSSVLLTRNGNKVIGIKRWQGQDVTQLVDKIAVECREQGIQRVYVDSVGLGAGVTDYGRRIGLPFIEINFARAASQRRRFANLRAEAWWRVRELLREGKIQIPNDSLLQGDLTAPKYSADLYQRILLESKDEIRERIKRSPDTGDALALSYATPMTDIDDGLVDALRQLGPSKKANDGGIAVAKWESGRFSRQINGLQRWKR